MVRIVASLTALTKLLRKFVFLTPDVRVLAGLHGELVWGSTARLHGKHAALDFACTADDCMAFMYTRIAVLYTRIAVLLNLYQM